MRLAVSGASNCGKTTLADDLARDLGLEIIPEYHGTTIEIGPQSPPQLRAKRLVEILDAKAARQDELPGGWISDRSPIDLAWFWLRLGLPERVPAQTTAFLTSCKNQVQNLDVLVFPPGPAPHEGRFNFGKRERVWEMLRNHSAMIGLAYQWLPASKIILIPPHVESPGQRVEWVLQHLPPE